MRIRLIQEIDAKRILEIYTPYVVETAISFEYEVPSLAEFRSRIQRITCDYPYLVTLCDDRIVGYAYAHRQKERAAYQWNAELSVYVDRSYVKRGIGKALYACLMEILKLQYVQNVYGVSKRPTPPVRAFTNHWGFAGSASNA
jgi:phosphinothricin acetyltransferase